MRAHGSSNPRARPARPRAAPRLVRRRSRSDMANSITVLPSCAFSSAGVPSAMTRPRSTTAICAASRSASSRYWVVSSTVVPSATSSRIVAQSALRLGRSRPVVGSSRNSTGGSAHERGRDVEPAPHPTRVRPDRSVGGRRELEQLQELGRPKVDPRARSLREAPDQPQVLAAGEVGVHRGGLTGQPDAKPHAFGVAHDVEPEHLSGAPVGLEDRREDADGRRLAGAVGPEEPEDGRGGHLEVDPREGLQVAEPFLQPTHRDRGIVRVRHRHLHVRGPDQDATDS